MLHAVTDIGSNTVKMNVYRVDDHQVEVIFSKKATLGLISYVKRKELSTEGIEKLVTTLEDLKNVLDLLNIKNSHFFSTASLRNIKNSAEVQEIIQKQVDIEVDVLSGEEEGEMSFYGTQSILKEDDGILMDLGGGSVELVQFKDKEITDKHSIKVGSLKMFNQYVSRMLPTREEESQLIKERVYEELEKTSLEEDIPFMCGVGGSLRVIKNLSVDLSLMDDDTDLMDVEILKKLENELKDNDRETYNKILRVKASRIHTLVPALLMAQAITSYFGCRKLQVSEFSIREGYLFKKVLGDGHVSRL